MGDTLENVTIREMTLNDYEEAVVIWDQVPGITLSDADSKESISQFLSRNLGTSLVAECDNSVIGTIMGGHDARRGYLHHLAVVSEFRGTGVANSLVNECLVRLQKAGINKCHLFVYKDNDRAIDFWTKTGWTKRTELEMFSKDIRDIGDQNSGGE